MIINASEIKRAIKPKADSTLNNMKKSELIEYIRCLEHNYNTAVWFNENQARYIEKIGIENVCSQWIGVRERTPRDMGDVLVVAYWHEKYQTLIGWYAKKSGMWHVNAGYEDRNGLHVTHWMPLPEPPKEDAVK